ncbi:MAG: SMC family ATPase [Nitrosopumilus sp.]|nr:SMC family ATPase [Nitrosopumilus sp.]
MLLNSIVIDNIRSYYHEEVEFPRGITLFEGDIGSGKSTVLMAIEFALFGLGSQKAESLLAKKSETGHVILDFSVDGEKYEIKRTLLRKNSSVNQDPKNSWIKIDGEKEPLSPSELKQRVLQILKFNEPADPKAESKIFRYAIFTPQEAMKEVLFDSKKRLETIRKAFGIEDYSIAESNAREVLSEIKTKSAVLKEKFSDILQLESEISKSKGIISELESEISEKQKWQKICQENENKKIHELKEIQAKNSEKIKLELTKDNLDEKIDANKTRIERIEQDFTNYGIELKENNEKLEKLLEVKKPETTQSIPDIMSEIKKFQKINDEVIKSKSEKNSIHQDITRLKDKFGEKVDSEKESFQGTLNDLLQEKESLEKFANEIKEKLEKVNDQKIQKETLKGSLENEIAKFSQLGNACPTCKQEITDEHHHSLVDEKKKEVESLSVELQSITDSFFESNTKSKEIQSKIDSYDQEILQIQSIIPGIEEFKVKSARENQLDIEIKELDNKLQDPEFEGKNPVEYLTELKDRVMQFESSTDQMKQIIKAKQKVEKSIVEHKEEIDSLDFKISEMETELEQIQVKLDSFENSEESVTSKENELDSLRKEITTVSSIIAASLENLKNETDKVKQNKSKIIESRKYETKYKKFDQFQEWLEVFFIPTISQIEKQVLLSILQNFNETYTRWYSILVEDPTKESRIDENFTPIVNQDGFDQEIGYLSGGEKTSIALAYRLTLNSLMRKETESMKSNLLILDEPTDGFSKNQLGKIRELLDELKSEQIILVSHEKELETYVDNIFQISKENGLSKILRMN